MAMQNTDLWREVFTKNLSEVFTRKLDMNSEHLDRDTPLKMDRLLTADFVCQNQLRGKKGVCGKKWDSISVTVTFQYEVEFNGFSKFMNHGVIQIQEYKQRCQRCSQSQSFATPILDYESADRAAKKLKQKILEKFYGESPQEFPDSSHGRKERKKPHDQANCEACLKGVGVCVASERRGAGKAQGWGQERKVCTAVRRGPKVGKWVLKINNSQEEIVIGEGPIKKQQNTKNNQPKTKSSSTVNSITESLSQLSTKSATNSTKSENNVTKPTNEKNNKKNNKRNMANPSSMYLFQDKDTMDFFKNITKEGIDSISVGCNCFIILYTNGETAWSSGLPKHLHNKLNGRQRWLPRPEIIVLGLRSRDSYYVQFADGKAEWCDLPDVLETAIQKKSEDGETVDLIAIGDDDDFYVRFKDGSENWSLPLELSNLLNGRNGSRRGNPNLAQVKRISLSDQEEWVVGFSNGQWKWSSNNSSNILDRDVTGEMRSCDKLYELQMGANGNFVFLYEDN